MCWWWASAGECLRPVKRDREKSVSLCLCLCSLSVCVCVCVCGSAWMRTMCLAVERWLIRALRQWPLCAQGITRTHRRPILHLPVVGRSTAGRHPHQQSRGCRPACNQSVHPIQCHVMCVERLALAQHDISSAPSFNLSSSSPPAVILFKNVF
eukprot:COSAG06_NODE_21504_length_754_cov_18.038168_1_plen_153_part_00